MHGLKIKKLGILFKIEIRIWGNFLDDRDVIISCEHEHFISQTNIVNLWYDNQVNARVYIRDNIVL